MGIDTSPGRLYSNEKTLRVMEDPARWGESCRPDAAHYTWALGNLRERPVFRLRWTAHGNRSPLTWTRDTSGWKPLDPDLGRALLSFSRWFAASRAREAWVRGGSVGAKPADPGGCPHSDKKCTYLEYPVDCLQDFRARAAAWRLVHEKLDLPHENPGFRNLSYDRGLLVSNDEDWPDEMWDAYCYAWRLIGRFTDTGLAPAARYARKHGLEIPR